VVSTARYSPAVQLDDAARKRLMWVVLGANIVAVVWTVALSNRTFGFAAASWLTVLWLAALVTWWWTQSTRLERALHQLAAQRRQIAYRAAGLDKIDAMSGVEFEQYVAAVFRGLGYQASTTKATGDFGVDIVATRQGIRTAVQCKRQGIPVGGAAVQQVVAGAPMHNCSSTAVVSNRSFTRAAQELAGVHGCRLIDREQLESMAVEASNADQTAQATIARLAAPSAAVSGNPSPRRELRVAAAVTVVVVLICSIVGVNRRHAVVAQEAAGKVALEVAQKNAPCPEPMYQLTGGPPEKVSPLPDLAGLSAQQAFDKLEALGIKDISWESTDPNNPMGLRFFGRTVVRTQPRAGCGVGPSDRVTFYARDSGS
jgi:restriction system protein